MTTKRVTGIIKRVGPCSGPDSSTDLQFILENDEEIYVVGPYKKIGLIMVGDHISFTFNSKLLMVARNVEDNDFNILNPM